MEFNSIFFLFFLLPVFLILFFCLKITIQNIYLLFFSLIFYYIGQGNLVLLLFVIIMVNYLSAKLIQKFQKQSLQKIALVFGISFNLFILLFYKYTLFLLSNLNELLLVFKLNIIKIPQIVLPVGISFITFHGISLLVDIYRKKVLHPVQFLETSFYFSFFPKLITGPIARYSQFYPQMKDQPVQIENIVIGIKRFTIGLGKKVLIADSLAAFNNQIFEIPSSSHGFLLAWLGAIGYSLQIYYDFSGYTDMAIGIAKILGFSLPENFNFPYIAKSIQDFWKRWHISLALWLQEYLFLPIAYSVLRKMPVEKYPGKKAENRAYLLGTFFTMALCGLWHGANWTFLLWGIYYGLLLIVEHFGLKKILKKKPVFIRICYSMLLVIVGWVLFRSPTVGYAISYLKSMTGFSRGNPVLYNPGFYINLEVLFFIGVGLVGIFPLSQKLKKLLGNSSKTSEKGKNQPGKFYQFLLNGYLFLVLTFSTVFLLTGTYNPFIYFKF